MTSSTTKVDDKGSSMEVERKINMTATLFPFVCGICYEKFNKIDMFYLHLQAHDQSTSDCFHVCNDHRNGNQTGSKLNEDKNIFQCGSCAKPFFSICTLHKHMIDVYDVGSYEFDQSSNTAFPKGESHGNNCLRHEIQLENGISQPDIEGGVIEFEKENKVEHKETIVNDSGRSNETLSRKGRKRREEEHGSENKQKVTKRKESRNAKRSSEVSVKSELKVDKSGIASGRPKTLKTQNNSKQQKHGKKSKKKELNIESEEQNTNVIGEINASVNEVNVENTHAVYANSEEVNSNIDSIIIVKEENVNSDLIEANIRCEGIEKELMNAYYDKKIHEKKNRKNTDSLNDEEFFIAKKKPKKYFYTCDICGKTMGLSHKKRHIAIHIFATEGKPLQEFETCDICGKSVARTGLKMHQALHSDDRPYLCDRCPKSFKLKSNLHHHKQIHDDFKPHACETCGKRFHRRTDLRFHLRVHSDERPAQCPQCPLRFRKTSTLNIHMKVHRGDKCYQCELCGKAFIRKDYLKRHKVWHSGQPCHECNVCGKKFMEKGGLQRHEKIHSEEKSHICHVCGKAFVLAANMKTHVKNVHGEKKEKKKSGSANTEENQSQTASASNPTEEPSQNMTLLQTYKVIIPDGIKEEQKKEYHTLMPRVGVFEMGAFPQVVQSSRNCVIPDFTNVQSTFYAGAQTGIQLPYDSSVINQIPVPARQIAEINSDVTTTQEYADQHHPSVQTVNVHFANTDHSVQFTNM